MPRGCRVIAVTALAALVCAGCSKTESAQARGRDDAAKRVKIELVRQEAVHRAVEVVGTLAAVDEVTVSSQAEGTVSRVLSDLGDRVTAGQPMVELDREKLQYNLDQQKAALARALAKYGANEPGRLPPIEQTPDVQKAAAELALAKQSHQRADELHKRELVPKQTLDDAEATLHAKQASYDSALQTAKNLRADIDATDAAAKLADRQLRDTYIRAPFDGYVQKRLVSLGELVKNQTPVMSVVRIDPLKVIAEIPERMAPWIRTGQPVALYVDAFPGTAIVGKVSRISPAVNAATRAFPFEALVPNGGAAALKPGAHRDRQDRPGGHAAVRRAAVPLRRQSRLRGDRRSARHARAEGRRSDRQSHRSRQRRDRGRTGGAHGRRKTDGRSQGGHQPLASR